MPDSEANEPSKADLEARIDQLEATVQKMMPTRRGVLTGLAGAGIGGAAVYGASENARAQAAGQVGTGTNPVDAFLWNLNVANQVTSDLAMDGNDVTGVGAMDVEQGIINNIQITPDNKDSFSTHKADTLSLDPNETHVILDTAEAVDVIGGHVFGGDMVSLEYVIDGSGVRLNGSGRTRGEDVSGDQFESLPMPPAKGVTKISFRNGSGAQSYVYGYVVNTI